MYLGYGFASAATVCMFVLTASIVWLQYRAIDRVRRGGLLRGGGSGKKPEKDHDKWGARPTHGRLVSTARRARGNEMHGRPHRHAAELRVPGRTAMDRQPLC